MKVAENGSDRAAEAHVYVDGRVPALAEYGEYVDGHDKAICCYVAVEEGQKLKINGRFAGTTLAVAHDVHVDGVCRKASSSVGKSVQTQKKRFEFESFLYQTSEGVIDTEISVAPYSGPLSLDKQALESVGTIELRLYVTRQFDVEHDTDDTFNYDKVKGSVSTSLRRATYKDIPPQFYMMFEENCSTLDGSKNNRERKKIYAKRPGKEPWAVFRFHYRTKESILDKGMEMTFHPTNKEHAKKQAHPLELEKVPLLLLGSKPASKNDGEASMRTSSPSPPETPSTPAKSSKKSQITQPKVVVKKQLDKLTSVETKTAQGPVPHMLTSAAAFTKPSTVITSAASTSKGSTPAHTGPKDHPSRNATTEKVSRSESTRDKPAAGMEIRGDPASTSTSTPIQSVRDTVEKAAVLANVASRNDTAESILEQATGKEDVKLAKKSTSTEPVKGFSVPVEISTTPTMQEPVDMPSELSSAMCLDTAVDHDNVVSNTKDFIKSGGRGFTSPLKKAAAKLAPLEITTSTDLQMPIVSSAPAAPIKRLPEGTLTPPPDAKRVKTDFLPPLTPTHLPRSVSVSPSPRTLSIEAQVAEQRKHLELARKKRAEMVRKKADIDKRLVPYKQRMAEELEHLRQELAKEEAMMAVEEEEYNASEMMLAEFETGGGEA